MLDSLQLIIPIILLLLVIKSLLFTMLSNAAALQVTTPTLTLI